VAWLLAEVERQPVLAVYEDLHWADPSTLELLGALLEQTPTVPMLTVLTFRPVFVPPWPTRSHMTPITLNRLERPQVEALITRLAGGKALPAEVVAHIVAKTDGVPLFVEELTKMLLESDLLHEDTQHYVLTGPLTAVTIPAMLQDSLMARLDRLGTARDVAQLGAVVGREFAYDVLQALAPLDETTLQTRLAQLVEAELLYQRSRPPRARYMFKHALIHDAAYASLLKSTRQQVHQQIAQVLETQFPASVESQPEVVAQHYTASGCAEQAVHYWQRRELGEMLLRLAQRTDAPALAVIAHYTLGFTSLCLGALPAARQHLEEGSARYTSDQHHAPVFRIGQDPGVACRIYAAVTLWLLGYPEQALARVHEALALAHELSHPFSLAFARCFAAIVSQSRRDVPAVHEQAEAAIALSTEQGFTLYAALGTIFRGWALAMQGQGEAGMAQVR
jgi:hypothetical protein